MGSTACRSRNATLAKQQSNESLLVDILQYGKMKNGLGMTPVITSKSSAVYRKKFAFLHWLKEING